MKDIGSIWNKWDLHIHSDASDGKMNCQEIIDKAKEEKLSVIALTDHHTVKNIDKGEFYQFNLSSCIRQQNSLTAQFVSFSLSNLANIFYPPPIFTIINLCLL